MAHAGEDAARHMDGIYKYQRYIYDATRKYFLLGRDHLIARLDPPPQGRVLEIGCGTGRNLILAARRYPDARFYGFDISEAMLETARAAIARAGLADRITVAKGDATAFDVTGLFGVDRMDRAFCSYTLSMIPPWKQVLPEAVKAVSPGGEVHVVDFGQQSGWPRAFRSLLFKWLDTFTVYPRAELETAMRETAAAAGAEVSFVRLYRDYAQYGRITARR